FSTTLQANSAPLQRESDVIAGASLGRLAELTRTGPETGTLARQAQGELHRRFSYPAAILAFGLLAVPLALSGRRFSTAAGGVVGLLATVVYYGLMQLGEGLVQAGVVGVGVGVWLPNLVMGVLAATLLWRAQWGQMGNWKAGRRESSAEKKSRAKDRPSRLPRYILPRYVARSYLQMLSLTFTVLLVGYLLVDVLERLQWLARYRAEALEVVRFYGVRIPLLASRVVPMSLLLATALTVSLLSAQRELTAMRACGVAAARALAPILVIAGIITPGYFLLNEVVVPRTNALADQLKETEIKDRGTEPGLLHMMIWYRAGTHVYQAQELDPKLGEAQEISIYELGADGLPVSRTDARAGKHIGNGVWELVDPVRVEISDQGLRRMTADPRAQLGEVPGTTVDTMHLGVRQLARQIHDAEVNGYDATTYRVDFHVQLATPLSCLLLPAVALFFAIGGPPFPSPAVTLLVGGGLAVSYVLLTGVGASLGYGGFLPPIIAGWGPTASLALLASALAVRSRG
ncbi:MAG: LptF/LptG family permease, partial [Candidatus Binatia bacterium]